MKNKADTESVEIYNIVLNIQSADTAWGCGSDDKYQTQTSRYRM